MVPMGRFDRYWSVIKPTLGQWSKPAKPAETPWWGLDRLVFAQRVKGFWTVGPTSIPVKREIYPTWLEHSE